MHPLHRRRVICSFSIHSDLTTIFADACACGLKSGELPSVKRIGPDHIRIMGSFRVDRDRDESTSFCEATIDESPNADWATKPVSKTTSATVIRTNLVFMVMILLLFLEHTDYDDEHCQRPKDCRRRRQTPLAPSTQFAQPQTLRCGAAFIASTFTFILIRAIQIV